MQTLAWFIWNNFFFLYDNAKESEHVLIDDSLLKNTLSNVVPFYLRSLFSRSPKTTEQLTPTTEMNVMLILEWMSL